MKRGKQHQEAGHRRLAYSVRNRLYADCISVDRFAICRNEGPRLLRRRNQACLSNLIALTVAIAHNLVINYGKTLGSVTTDCKLNISVFAKVCTR